MADVHADDATDAYHGVVCARADGSLEVEVSGTRCAGCAHGCGRVRLHCGVGHTDGFAIGSSVVLRVPRAAVRRAAYCAFAAPLTGLLVGVCVVAPLTVPGAGEVGAAAIGGLAALAGGVIGWRFAPRERPRLALTASEKC